MKHFFTTTITLLLSLSCLHAQRIHFTDTSNRWEIVTHGFGEIGTSYRTIQLQDTIIESSEWLYFELYDWGTIVLLREDTANGKVFAKYPAGWDTTTFVFYDFDMAVGDSLKIPGHEEGTYLYTICHEILPDVMINDIPHKTFRTGTLCDELYNYVIEGVGSVRGPQFQLFFDCGEYPVHLNCFEHKGGHPVFSAVFDNKCLHDDIEKVQLKGNQVRISPNPALDKLFLEAETPVRLSIHNILGRQVYQGTLKDRLILDISAWQAGTYLVRFIDTKSSSTVKRFLKL